ncbi:tRNA epoxyqueuosine(34) reductase QueG [Leptospira sp. 96542]|nr:tRNA epoxyqueuosine(34) reductase QueG [Leptospira sp. 96542]
MSTKLKNTQLEIKTICEGFGFSLVGFTRPNLPPEDIERLEDWIKSGKHGTMDWFAKDRAKEIRNEFKHLGFEPVSVVVLGYVYRSNQSETLLQSLPSKISRYALGDDYHLVLREKGQHIIKILKERYPSFKFRQSVDSLPIAEKVLAKQAGIGWQGKNTNIIHPKLGSYFFISTILTDMDLNPEESKMTDHCGSCRRCLDICPTNALEEYKLDARKCISYQTIEDRKKVNLENPDLHNWVYGCDLCQEVCPWNLNVAMRNGVETDDPALLPRKFWKDNSFWDKKEFLETEFESLFKNSPIERIGVDVWNRNWNGIVEPRK